MANERKYMRTTRLKELIGHLDRTRCVKLGPLTQEIVSNASWFCTDDFPSNQEWADYVERVLAHLKTHGQFDRFLPRLRGKLTQRDGALAEARVSFLFHGWGFSITSWEPRTASGSLGEFEIQWKSTSPIFVEVKGPRWEGEMDQSERTIRKREGKYKSGEARTLDTIGKVIEAIDKAKKQNKFSAGKPNLLVICTTNLFVSPTELSDKIVKPKVEAALKSALLIGGVLLLNIMCQEMKIRYETLFVTNSTANEDSKLPLPVEEWLLSNNTGSQTKRGGAPCL